jgi:hypothetical protein
MSSKPIAKPASGVDNMGNNKKSETVLTKHRYEERRNYKQRKKEKEKEKDLQNVKNSNSTVIIFFFFFYLSHCLNTE